jgi:predicted 3-demethylubiquinone-9 3-methyltransferase (glyoxalase superfamily)
METQTKINQQKIVPCLWFDDNAAQAIELYISCFKNASHGKTTYYDKNSAKASGRPEGSLLTETFMLNGQEFMALNGGPYYKLNPAVSFFVNCQSEDEIDLLYQKLSVKGKILMEYKSYPFSKKYAWIEDEFGLSWQLNLTGEPQKINPMLMFNGKNAGKAQEAIDFYTSVFNNSKTLFIAHYEEGLGEPTENIVHARFSLDGEEFLAMDSSRHYDYSISPSISFMIFCADQQEVDYFWEKLTEGGKEVECGWLEDKYGVSWQVVPTVFLQMITQPDKERAGRVMQAMLTMKKFDIATLEKANG